jgi:gamma-glutamylcyclotransferase (GGCT)/AIG2-like uncharacterized protein YtfP
MPLFSSTYQPVRKNPETQKYLVFVYGSLLKDFGNHHRLETYGTKFIGYGNIRANLYTSHWAYPFIILSHNNHDRVHGEVYEVDYRTLRSLDQLEGYNPRSKHNFYTRTKVIAIMTHFEPDISSEYLSPNLMGLTKDASPNAKLLISVYTGDTSHSFNRGQSAEHIISGNWRKAKNEHDKVQPTRFTAFLNKKREQEEDEEIDINLIKH